jgi:AcrR family transcriptional regulator
MPYRPTPRTEARKADLRRRILTAARDLVSANGFEAAQVASVAERAGVATGTVYRYFPSKSDLLREVFREACGHEMEVLAEEVAQPGKVRERLTRALEVFARRAIRGRRLAYALIAEPIDVGVDEERIRFRTRSAEMFSQVLEEGVAAGEFPTQNVAVTAACLVGAVSEALVGPLMPGAKAQVEGDEELIRSIVQFCMRAVSEKEPSLC